MLGDVSEAGYPSDCVWSLGVSGRFLRIVSEGTRTGRHARLHEYNLETQGIKKHWQSLSHLFLGNVLISAKHESGAIDLHSTIYVYLDCTKKEKRNLVTVVESLSQDEPHQVVQLEPSQVLEVVAADQVLTSLDFRAYRFPMGQGTLLLRQVHHECIPVGEGTGAFGAKKDHHFYCERRILPDTSQPLFAEHHYFFSFPAEPSSYLSELGDGCFAATRLAVIGKSANPDEPSIKDNRVDTFIRIRGSVRRREERYAKSPRPALERVDPLERIYDETSRCLINPAQSEQIHLLGDGDEFWVEIAQPSVYFGKAAQPLTEANWTCSVRSAHVRDDRAKHLKVEQGNTKWVNSVRFQRFKLRLEDVVDVENEVIIAKFVIACPEVAAHVSVHERTIYVLYSRRKAEQAKVKTSHREVKYGDSSYQVVSHKGRASSDTAVGGKKSRGIYRHNSSSACPSYSTKKNKKKKKGKKYCAIEYWQVELVDDGDDLVTGESVEYMSTPLSKRSSKWQSDAHGGGWMSSGRSGGMIANPDRHCYGSDSPLSNFIDAEWSYLDDDKGKSRKRCSVCKGGFINPHYINYLGQELCDSCGSPDENPTQAASPKIGEAAAKAGGSQNRSESEKPQGESEKPQGENDSSKSSLTEAGRRQNVSSVSERNRRSVLEKASEKSSGMLTIATKKEMRLYWPRSNQDVELRRGEPLFIYMPLPKGEFRSEKLRKQWTVNVVDMNSHAGLKLWIQSNKLIEPKDAGIVHQEIEIRPLTPRSIEAGKHLVGAVRLRCDDETRMLNVYLRVGEDDPRETLSWHLDYYRCVRKAKHIKTGMVFEQHHSQVDNRTTLVDPVGEKIDIPVKDVHDVEIILGRPYKGDDRDGWELHPRVLGGGDLKVLDYSTYSTWRDDKIHRALFRLIRGEGSFWGEIKLTWNGEDTDTQICFYGARDTDKPPVVGVGQQVKTDPGRVQISGNPGDRNKIRIEDWRNGQHAVIFPYEYVHIAVPVRADFLDAKYKSLAKQSRWAVEFVEVSLEEEVWQLLPPEVRSKVDRIIPYYEDHGVFHPGAEPWDEREFILPPLDTTQPFIYDIQDAMETIYGVQPSYPLADLKFSYEVDGRFTITQELHLHLGSYRAMSEEAGCPKTIVCDNPHNQSNIRLHDGEGLSIRLPYVYRTCRRTGERAGRVHWSCDSAPIWLVRWDSVDDKDREREVFNFRCDVPPYVSTAIATLKFTNSAVNEKDGLNLEKRITVQGQERKK